jgi:enterochelin esterase-like enzyme
MRNANHRKHEFCTFYFSVIQSAKKMKAFILWIILFWPLNTLHAQLPKVSFGKIDRIENFESKYVTSRNVDVWLPEGYSPQKKYAVLYMHDGQMLFDSSITWNNQSWKVSETLHSLLATKQIRDVIVVGIWNGGSTRHSDYFPQKPFEALSSIEKDTVVQQLQSVGRAKQNFTPNSDNYLKFLVTELKPFIDKKYSTHKGNKNTFVAGSSMGGLISMYAICEYPTIFGGAACLSTHWPGTFTIKNNPIPNAFVLYLKSHLPDPKNHKIYFDCGDQTLDALYPPLQKQIDEVMKAKGFDQSNWMTRLFPGEDHSEKAWAKRFATPLLFLLNR